MKKILLLFFVCTSSIINAQQEQDSDETKQELKFNLAMSIAGVPELTYEYFLEDNSSVGASIAIGLENAEDMSLRFILSPYYRLFFGKKKNAGFFIEANSAIATYRDIYNRYEYYYDDNGEYREDSISVYDKKTTNFGLGAAVGFKLLTRNNYIGEIYAGAGRLFGDSNDIEVYPRVGITIGKRF
ncbi:conserved hypothetical protein [Zunongwangia profunda SM-A87]|uniref:DUF3575 domain-containing protein n=1 Tax=Zunongwangia profunda (strain DSM 18752 / CCTCC AB 206139 / SM-A87) TaxID=655815 RepID=D5BCB8_ZUNPS|nr:DUF3575 domain-containing protein [Zunongwangia profunda]ADF54744.1 conserved hypothetical protein [Zunongwangia profunda SM-A87]